MQWWQIGLLVVLGLIVWQTAAYFLGNPRFWRLVGRHPDLALKLFAIERGCILDGRPLVGSEESYVGPFRWVTSDGTKHLLYIKADEIDGIQARVAQVLKAADRRLS